MGVDVASMGATAAGLSEIVGGRWVSADPDVVSARTIDWTRRVGPTTAVLVRPADAAQVAKVLAWCASATVPVVPQGGNTGLVEGSVPTGRGWVVLSTERLTDIGEIDPIAGQITVGAGVTLAGLQLRLRGSGWRVGVDLAARDRATIGGMIATNAGGTGVFRHGSMRSQLLGVEAACVDGTVLDGRRAVTKDNTGYDLAALLCGSEGTLAVVTSARLALLSEPPARVTALIGFAAVDDAARVGWELARRMAAVEVVELIGPGCVDLVAAQHRSGPPPALSGAGAALLVEAAGADIDSLAELMAAGLDAAGVDPARVAVATTEAEAARLWRWRDGIPDALGVGPAPLKLDVSVPAADLAGFVAEVAGMVAAAGGESGPASVYAFGHLCDHNLHINVRGLVEGRRRGLERQILGRVVALGGSISAEHGIGRKRVADLAALRSVADLERLRRIKAAWDPAGILNPGVIVARSETGAT